MGEVSEKLFLELKNTDFSYANIALANVGNILCSIIAHGFYPTGDRFIHLHVNKTEAKKIRDALTKIIRGMKDDVPQ